MVTKGGGDQTDNDAHKKLAEGWPGPGPQPHSRLELARLEVSESRAREPGSSGRWT